jgi:hypothetical protein
LVLTDFKTFSPDGPTNFSFKFQISKLRVLKKFNTEEFEGVKGSRDPHVSNLDRTIGLAGCEDESCASDLGGEAMRGCGIPRGFWLKPGGSADRVEGIIIETL